MMPTPLIHPEESPVGVPPTRPADRAFARPRRRPIAAVAATVALLAVGAGVLVGLSTPAPRPADAPEGEFSAGRAFRNVEVIAAEPHVAGSAANDRVREHLVGTLRGLGLQTEVQDAVAPEAGQLSGAAGGATLARVRNVVARLPGTDPTGKVFLVSHYDSVQTGPGGNDDAAGTATILEVARALTTGPRLRNDIVFVLTDAEEACLCGAAGFAADHPLARDGGVVLNLEARGSTGPVIMFETSRNNAKLVEVFGKAAPHPVGTSFAVEIYRALPNDTDFTAFLDRKFVGLNSAYIDGGAIYHTPLDVPARVDRGSLQMHGDNALGLAREFGRTDLGDLSAGHDDTYFPVLGGLVRYPGWLTLPLAVAALLAVGALGWLLRRRGRREQGDEREAGADVVRVGAEGPHRQRVRPAAEVLEPAERGAHVAEARERRPRPVLTGDRRAQHDEVGPLGGERGVVEARLLLDGGDVDDPHAQDEAREDEVREGRQAGGAQGTAHADEVNEH